jgi:hypothetical protein
MKIDFTKLLNGFYPLEIEMEMINWFLNTGNKYDEYTGRWTKDGVSKQIFGYGANSHNANFPFPIVCENSIGNGSLHVDVFKIFIQNCLFNAILKNPLKPVEKWRKEERIELGKSRMLNFNTEYPTEKNEKFENTFWAITDLKDFIDTPLKKELFHPDYPKRLNPKIINVILYTNGGGYVFEYIFSFSTMDYENGWTKQIWQEKNESIPCFINRIFNEIDLVRADS